MKSLFWLAGSLAAHGIWTASKGETLIPMLAFDLRAGQQQMMQLVDQNLEDGVANGRQRLENPDADTLRAVLAFDAFVETEGGQSDALIVDGREYATGEAMSLAVPYQPASHRRGFLVRRPIFRSFSGPEEELPPLADAFFAGVEAHTEAAAAWDRYSDPL